MSLFRFKQFAIEQSAEVFKVSTDSVVLGAWANVSPGQNVLDLGCGTGLLALMVAQRNPIARIEAIDINEAAIALATKNFNRSSWANRLTANNVSLKNYDPSDSSI